MSEKSACACGGGCCGGPGKWILVVLIVAIAGVLMAKHVLKSQVPERAPAETPAPAGVEATGPQAGTTAVVPLVRSLPRLVDLGATKCIPCKMMVSVLDDLKKTYAGKLEVEFIDVWENPNAGKQYKINLIPTQIFHDAGGKELFRHEGFFSKEDILAKWKELGVSLTL